MEKLIIILLFWLGLMLLVYNIKKIERLFHLTDKRTLISGVKNYNKLNALMEQAEVSLYTFEAFDESNCVNLSVEYKKNEVVVKGAFRGEDINSVINQAYNWSVANGFVK